jgi:hypothetical protein
MTFLAEAARWIQERATRTPANNDSLDFVPLAAHLFAIGNQILLNEGSARLMDRQDRPQTYGSLEELRQELAGTSENINASAFYRTIIKALVTIESELVRTPGLAFGIPASTELQPLTSKNFRGVTGRVHHWLRPQSALEKLRYDRLELIEEGKSHPPDPSPHPGIYLDRLALYWDSDPQLPAVSRVRPTPDLDLFFKDWWDRESPPQPFRIAFCPLEGSFHPRFCIDTGFFHAEREIPIHGAVDLAAYLESLLDAADAEEDEDKVNLILLPELTVDRTARSHLQRLLRDRCGEASRLCGVVAGSFHLWDSEKQVDGEPPPFNETVFLDRTGAVVTTHRKKGRFRVPASDLLDALFPDRGDVLRAEIFENIRYGTELKILDTPLGRLALLICADAIAADDRGFLPVIRRLRPDLLLVVSMTPETEPFDAFASEMSRYWVGTVFVNAHCLLEKAAEARADAAKKVAEQPGPPRQPPPPPNLAALDLALHENKGDPPTRVRWQYAQAEPDCFYFNLAGEKRVWRALSKAPPPHGVSLLQKNGRAFGVVLDLGAHWNNWRPKRK